MKTAAIILWVIQGVALVGCFVDPNGLHDNFFQWLGFFTPTIIGIILWVIANKKSKKAGEQEEKDNKRDNIKMNPQYGTKWFTFFTKVRPWLVCVTALTALVDFVQYVDIYLSHWWLLLSFATTVTGVVLAIMTFVKSKGDYVEFVGFVKKVLFFEVFSIAYQKATQSYINSGFDLGFACLLFVLFAILVYFVWYRLNIKYFKKRIITTSDNFQNEENDCKTTKKHYCTQCGNKLNENSKFCGNCGDQVVKE